ncbi:MAG: C10 family peptidase [Bacteroidales bacterium]|nr:C10 family peptidase [Bacteroidales bacterium]
MRIKLIILLFLLLYSVLGLSQTPNDEEIKTVAVNFYCHLTKSSISANEIKIQEKHYFQQIHTYSTVVFKNNDWLIISAEKKADPILVFSIDKNYSNFVPPPAKEWLMQYDYYIYNIKVKNIFDENEINYTTLWDDLLNDNLYQYKNTKDQIIVEPLITSKWGQYVSNDGSDPIAYNYYAPPGYDYYGNTCNQTHAVAGCPAVAAGQVLRYWKYPNCDIFDWSKMPNILNVSNSNYNEYKKEIANLLRNIADKMQIYMENNDPYYYFGCDVSGTNSVEAILYPLKDNFYFNSATIIKKENYSANDWKDKLCYELDNYRPIIYAGNRTSQGGHIFVCDGWKKPLFGKKFHFNFGWNGSHDAYYRFGNAYEYPYNQKAIIGIYPSANCSSTLNIYQWFKNVPISDIQNLFYNPKAGYIYSSPSPIIVGNNDNVHYQAYNEIVLTNFETEEGSDFIAEIVPCPNPTIVDCNIFYNYKTSSRDLVLLNNEGVLNNNAIEVYPNPSNDIFTLSFYAKPQNGIIKVYNCVGKLILEKNVESTKVKINLSDQASGIYFLKCLSNNNNIYHQKIIKK